MRERPCRPAPARRNRPAQVRRRAPSPTRGVFFGSPCAGQPLCRTALPQPCQGMQCPSCTEACRPTSYAVCASSETARICPTRPSREPCRPCMHLACAAVAAVRYMSWLALPARMRVLRRACLRRRAAGARVRHPSHGGCGGVVPDLHRKDRRARCRWGCPAGLGGGDSSVDGISEPCANMIGGCLLGPSPAARAGARGACRWKSRAFRGRPWASGAARSRRRQRPTKAVGRHAGRPRQGAEGDCRGPI